MGQNINGLSVPVIGSVTMSSQEIARLVESRHSDVCRTIARLMTSSVIGGYAPLAYTHPQNGKTYNYFEIGKRDSYVIVAQLSPQFTGRLVDRWLELEMQATGIPQTYPEALRLAASLAEEKNLLEKKVQQDAPKVAYFDDYIHAKDTKSIRETAKLLNLSERALVSAMIRDRILFRQAGILLPLAIRQADGHFTVKTGKSDGGRAFTQTRVTPKGIAWLSRRYASELEGYKK